MVIFGCRQNSHSALVTIKLHSHSPSRSLNSNLRGSRHCRDIVVDLYTSLYSNCNGPAVTSRCKVLGGTPKRLSGGDHTDATAFIGTRPPNLR